MTSTATCTKAGQQGMWLEMAGRRRTSPFKLLDQPHQFPESNSYKKDSQRRTPAEPKNWPVPAQRSKAKSLKAAIFLYQTLPKVPVHCESPVCHAWGQLRMESLIKELFTDWPTGLMTEEAATHCTCPWFQTLDLHSVSASPLRLYSENSWAREYMSTLLF